MRIGELAAATGVSARSLRYYEQQDLIRPQRLHNGYRTYGDDQVERVAQIRELIDSGVPTRVVREMIPCLDFPDKPMLGPADPRVIAMLEQERDAIATRIDVLARNLHALDSYLSAARERSR